MDKKISKNRQKKEAVVAELSEKVKRAHGVVLTNYKGLTHQQLETFKKGLRDLNAEFAVTKNTLLKIAIEKDHQSLLISHQSSFNNPTATLFMYADPVAPLKALAKMIKDYTTPAGGPGVKFGIVEGQALDGASVLKLAALPPREQLIAQFVGGMKSPLYGIHRALSWNMQKLVMTLKAIENKKQ